MGHGMSAVLMSSAVINSLRNTRRERGDLLGAYQQADELIATHFGNSCYVTGQFGSLDLRTGVLTWVNAGHLPPMLVRNGSYVGELQCAPSMPLGLGGPIVEVAQETLQRGDRVLFYTDGISESLSPDGTRFGQERLADMFVRAALDELPGAETVRRLSAAVGTHVGKGLLDDATMLLVEYRLPAD
jgi:serine phosphatase RsbU (regulator of sigma subunit)